MRLGYPFRLFNLYIFKYKFKYLIKIKIFLFLNTIFLNFNIKIINNFKYLYIIFKFQFLIFLNFFIWNLKILIVELFKILLIKLLISPSLFLSWGFTKYPKAFKLLLLEEILELKSFKNLDEVIIFPIIKEIIFNNINNIIFNLRTS